MDELHHIRNLRADVPASDSEARRAAREVLLSRIEASPRARRWRLAVVVVAVALAAVTAASALALYDFIAGEPAPPNVTKRLVDEGTAERIGDIILARNPNVIAEEAHGVVAVETSAGRAILWAAPTGVATICYFVEVEAVMGRRGAPQGEADCVPHPSTNVPLILAVHRVVVDGNELPMLVGRAVESVASVVLRSPEGTERELSLSEGLFLAEIPADLPPKDRREGRYYSVIARDDAGVELERIAVGAEFAGSAYPLPKLAGARRTVIDATDSRGRPMSLALVPIEGGETCVEIKTRTGTRGHCGRSLVADQGVMVHPTLMGSMVFVSGAVGPEVAKLELHHQDGSVVELPIVERFVLHDIPRSRFEDGKRPILLVARGPDGSEVARRKVNQKAYFESSNLRSGGDVSP